MQLEAAIAASLAEVTKHTNENESDEEINVISHSVANSSKDSSKALGNTPAAPLPFSTALTSSRVSFLTVVADSNFSVSSFTF